jgi:hypothetical protein
MNPTPGWKHAWSDNEQRAARVVCSTFDVIGMLVQADLIDDEPFTSNWGAALIYSWAVCEPFVRSMQVDNGASYWGHFEAVAKMARDRVDVPLLPEPPKGRPGDSGEHAPAHTDLP